MGWMGPGGSSQATCQMICGAKHTPMAQGIFGPYSRFCSRAFSPEMERCKYWSGIMPRYRLAAHVSLYRCLASRISSAVGASEFSVLGPIRSANEVHSGSAFGNNGLARGSTMKEGLSPLLPLERKHAIGACCKWVAYAAKRYCSRRMAYPYYWVEPIAPVCTDAE